MSRTAKISRPKGLGYVIEFRDPMPGDTVVVKFDKPTKDGQRYGEVRLREKVKRGLFKYEEVSFGPK